MSQSEALRPFVLQVNLENAGQEYSLTVPKGTKHFTIQIGGSMAYEKTFGITRANATKDVAPTMAEIAAWQNPFDSNATTYSAEVLNTIIGDNCFINLNDETLEQWELTSFSPEVWTKVGETDVSAGSGVAVQDEGSEVVASASTLDFVGAGVTATDGGGGKATITIPGEHTGTTGSVFFAGAGGAGSSPTEDNANFFWDDTADELGLGTNAPGARLHVTRDISTGRIARFIKSGTANTEEIFYVGDNGADADLLVTGDGRVGVNIDQATLNAQLRVETAISGGPTLASCFAVIQRRTGNEPAIIVSHSGTTGDGINLTADSITSAIGLDISCNALTTGSIAYFASTSSSTATRYLVDVRSTNSAAANAHLMMLRQNGTGAPFCTMVKSTSATDIAFQWIQTGEWKVLAEATSDAAPSDDTTLKKMSLQRLGSDPTNAAFIKFSNSPGTPTNDFYLVLEEG